MTAVDIRPQFDETVAAFKSASVDCQLAVLWQAYDTLGQAFASVAPVALFSQAVQQLISQLKQLNREEQVEILRDILCGEETRFSQAYGALNTNMRLAFWHRLFSQGNWQILPQLSACLRATPEAQALAARLGTMGLNERLNFLCRVLA